MKKYGISVTVISDKDSTRPETEEIETIKVFRLGHPTLMVLFRKGELTKSILKSEPDAIVWFGSPLSAIYLSRLKAVKKPLLWVMDTDLGSLKLLSHISSRELFDSQNTSLWFQLMTAFLPRCFIRRIANSALIHGIIVPSNHHKTSLAKIGVNPQKVVIIPSTIDTNTARNPGSSHETTRFREEAGLRAEDFIMTYFGSPSTLRGIDTAVRSVPKILPKVRNTKLLILSRRNLAKSDTEHQYFDEEEKRLKQLIRTLGVEDNVEIVPGLQSKSRLRQYIRASDVIALPFKIIFSDPPLSVLEAMSLGKVVVTTNMGSLREIVHGNRGILIEPNNSDALAHAVIFLAEHPDQKTQLEHNAQQFAANLPDWDSVSLKFAELIRTVNEENA